MGSHGVGHADLAAAAAAAAAAEIKLSHTQQLTQVKSSKNTTLWYFQKFLSKWT